MLQRKIALFGGTFDPVHLGHTEVAGAAAKQIQAQKVIFIPAKCSPLKGFSPHASDEDRLRMLELTIADEEMFSVSDCELRRPAPSYTLDTVRQFKRQYGPGVEIHWLLGADAVNDFVHWHRIEELIDECHLTTMQRAGYESPNFRQFEPIWGAERIRKLEQDTVHTPLVDVSSTEVRSRLRSGRDVRGMLHPHVIEYIRKRGLYRRTNEETN